MRLTTLRRQILRTLINSGGTIRDDEGHATSALAVVIDRTTGDRTDRHALRRTLGRMEEGGLIKRELDGKRCTTISIMPAGVDLMGERQGPTEPTRYVLEGEEISSSALLNTMFEASQRLNTWALQADSSRPVWKLRIEGFDALRSHLPPAEFDAARWRDCLEQFNALASAFTAGQQSPTLAQVEAMQAQILDLTTQLSAHKRHLDASD